MSIRDNESDYLTITTNGSLINRDELDYIASLGFERVMLSISVDSLSGEIHDRFRHFDGAFKMATNALKITSEYYDKGIVASMKTVILPDTINDMEEFVKLALKLGCKRISFMSVISSGKATQREDLWLNPQQKRRFLEEIYRLKSVYTDINVTTNDPLKCIVRGYSDISDNEDELIFDGCPAATVAFNVNSDGVMTPCPLLDVPMMNMFKLSMLEIEESYITSPIVKDMLEMNLAGKCGECSKKYQCGGCRARALAQNNDLMGEDPECWI